MTATPISAATAQAITIAAAGTTTDDRATNDTIGFVNSSIRNRADFNNNTTSFETTALATFLIRQYPTGLTILTPDNADLTPAYKQLIVLTSL